MNLLMFANNATSTLTAGISAVATSITVQTGDASKFPSPTGGRYFKVTLIRANTGEKEVVHCTARAGAVLTIVRAQEGTTGITFSASDIVSMRMTKGLAERFAAMADVTDFCVKDYGAIGDGVTDDTAAIQAAVNAAANARLFFPKGNYKITAQINILTRVHIYASPYTATIYIGTPNINGFVVGDGTVPTQTNVYSTYIVGLQFAALNIAASTSGACIFINHANYVVIRDVGIDCRYLGTRILWDGIYIYKSLEWVVDRPLINGPVNNCIRMVGIVTVGQTCGDGRIDFGEFISAGGDCLYCGDYTGAITFTAPIFYSHIGWGIKIDCTGAAGVGANYLITAPDMESSHIPGAAGGLYVKQGTAQVEGGWMGGTAGLKVDATGSSVTMSGVIVQADVPVVISGPACSLIGCDIAGDSVTTTTGVLLNAGATDTNIVGGRIRQFTTEGVKFVGGPARCTILGVNFRSNATDITGITTDINATVAPKGTTNPVPTSGAGAFTTVASVVNWTKAADRATVEIAVTITTNGTAATYVKVQLPFTPAVVTGVGGQETGATNKALAAVFSTDGFAYIYLYDGTYPGADGRVLRVSGSYKV